MYSYPQPAWSGRGLLFKMPSSNQTTNLSLADSGLVNSFAGTDITAYMFLPLLSQPLRLGSLAEFSYSTMRPKSLVTQLGVAKGRAFTRGIRVVAGTLIFLQLDRTAFSAILAKDVQTPNSPYSKNTLPDELPPFDLLITFVNEEGVASFMKISRVEIVQSQGTNSIYDINPQESFSFVALDITPLLPGDIDKLIAEDKNRITSFSIGKPKSSKSKKPSGQLINPGILQGLGLAIEQPYAPQLGLLEAITTPVTPLAPDILEGAVLPPGSE